MSLKQMKEKFCNPAIGPATVKKLRVEENGKNIEIEYFDASIYAPWIPNKWLNELYYAECAKRGYALPVKYANR
ncbi:MAG: hypothetical protein J5973_08605 [Eubacterium sp.]|nr:hypothetical protein [Eubacterium sp.]